MGGFLYGLLGFTSNLAVGVGIGIGVTLAIKNILRESEKKTDHILICLKQLTIEVENIKTSLFNAISNEVTLSAASTSAPALLAKVLTSASSVGPTSPTYTSDDEDEEFFDPEPRLARTESFTLENLEKFFTKVDELLDGTDLDKQEAHNLLSQMNRQLPGNCGLLWRFARAQYQMAAIRGAAGDAVDKKIYIEKGLKTASEAVAADGENDKAHKWYAILVGNYSDFQGTKEKILAGHEYQKHIERAVELNPTDPYNVSLLGRFCYEIYMLPWYMRKTASTLFAEPPTSSAEEAMGYFMKAEKLRPGFWTENALFLGKCYFQLWDYQNAKIWFKKTTEISSNCIDDDNAITEALQLLEKC